jgi:NAD(P)-dependent dehydrogenase (short-subunit alcohol dehydrogenase family)
VLVTGATRGIGRQLADDLLGLGAQLALTGTKQHEIDRLNAQSGDRATYYRADFPRRESLDAFIDVPAHYDRIDVCINNAVSPGFTRTEMVEQNYSEAERQAIEARIPASFLYRVKAIS